MKLASLLKTSETISVHIGHVFECRVLIFKTGWDSLFGTILFKMPLIRC